MSGFIKLTSDQAAQLADLSGSNPTNDFVTPRADANGDLWLNASILKESSGLFAHYGPLLATLTVTQFNPPAWPPDPA